MWSMGVGTEADSLEDPGGSAYPAEIATSIRMINLSEHSSRHDLP